MDPHELEPDEHQFEQMDADAVCAQCNTVNDEGTLLCKACGNNLRDQRAERIAQATGGDYITPRKSPVRLLTGLLILLGTLSVFYALWNLQGFEDMMLESISSRENPADQDLWSGTYAQMYEDMLTDIEENPTSENIRRISIDAPVTETAYSGRYLVIPASKAISVKNVIGEAELKRNGEIVHFAFLSDRSSREARGVTVLEEDSETGELSNPIVRDSAGFYDRGELFVASGASIPIPSGGHTIFVSHEGTGKRFEFIVYRVKTNL